MGHNKRLQTIVMTVLLCVGTLFVLYGLYRKNYILKDVEVVKGGTSIDCEAFSTKVKTSLSQATVNRQWYIKGDAIDSQYSLVKLSIPNASLNDEDVNSVEFEYRLDSLNREGNFVYSKDSRTWEADFDVKALNPGTYSILVAPKIEECESSLTKYLSINVSYPVYVAWTMDWEGFDTNYKYLDQISDISSTYGVPITHFFNPYIFIHLNPTRAQYFRDWVVNRSNNNGDSIGLHLHMYNKMVSAAGVVPQNSVEWGGPQEIGYDVPSTVYGYSDYTKILTWALNQFEANNLPRPTMFRAGGWYIDEENLQALEDMGFKIDSSGRTEYAFGTNKLPGEWHLADTTQPYGLNSLDQNITNDANMTLWEFPNNGAESWSFSAKQMIERFTDNYNGGTAASTKVVTFLSHPHGFNVDDPKMREVFSYTSKYLLSDDKGPVIYTTIDNIPH